MEMFYKEVFLLWVRYENSSHLFSLTLKKQTKVNLYGFTFVPTAFHDFYHLLFLAVSFFSEHQETTRLHLHFKKTQEYFQAEIKYFIFSENSSDLDYSLLTSSVYGARETRNVQNLKIFHLLWGKKKDISCSYLQYKTWNYFVFCSSK